MSKTVILTIRDEVNVKLDGIDAADRRALVKMFSWDVPGARYLPSVRLGRWDGKVSYFQLSGMSYVNLLDQIIPFLVEKGYDIELNDIRQYSTNFQFNEVDEQSFSHKLWPVGHPASGQPVVIRDYQVEIINNFLKNPQCIQEVATGAGKTLMTAALSLSVEQMGRSIVVVPNKDLVKQTEADYVNLGLDVGVYYGDRKEWGKTHTICTWQSLNVLLKNTKSGDAEVTIQEFVEDVVCLIIDECFDGDSLVLTPTGYVPIKMIQPGDVVLNYSESTGEFKEDIVVKRHENLTKSSSEKMYEMEFDNGSKIKVTGNHKFLTNDGWVRADELTENHEIVSTNINTLH